jgi:hypothetical protein
MMGFSQRLLAQQCSAGADVLAVFWRTSLVNIMVQQGVLDEWREGNELREPVFWGAATFPLPNGLNHFEVAEFIGKLRTYDSQIESHGADEQH